MDEYIKIFVPVKIRWERESILSFLGPSKDNVL